MSMRIWGFGLTSRYALCHLLLCLILITQGPGGEWITFFLLGFPLLYPLLLFGDAGPTRTLGPAVGVGLVVVLGVTNSYLWGATAACVHRWVRKSNPPGGTLSTSVNSSVTDH